MIRHGYNKKKFKKNAIFSALSSGGASKINLKKKIFTRTFVEKDIPLMGDMI